LLRTPVHAVRTGINSSIGKSVDEVFDALKAGKAGIGRLNLFSSAHRDEVFVGEVAFSNDELADSLDTSNTYSRTALLALHASSQAINGLQNDLKKFRTAFISANTVGGMDRTENYFAEKHKNKAADIRLLLQHPCFSSTEIVARKFGFNGFVSTINTACSSSVNAIILGTRLIENNKTDFVLAGGTDALSKFTLNGFKSLMILDNEPCKPFDAKRNGLNLGEGAGYVLLASEKAMREMGLASLGRVSGYANTNDAFHQTASSPDGKGSYMAMSTALAKAALKSTDIDYINLHGTGTLNNDASEGTAIRNFFGENLPTMSSTKAYTGHTLGASGSIEAIISLLAIQHQCVFPNLRFSTPIAETGIVPATEFRSDVPVKHVLSNSFGFGGNCSSIVLSAT